MNNKLFVIVPVLAAILVIGMVVSMFDNTALARGHNNVYNSGVANGGSANGGSANGGSANGGDAHGNNGNADSG